MSALPEGLTLASRGSALARRQAGIVSELIRAAHPRIHVSVRTVTTAGDRDRRPFGSIAGRGVFVAEIEREVVEGRADLAVHSAKDLTADLAEGCTIACIPARSAPQDVVLGGQGTSGEERLRSLSRGARVGTSSARRRALVGEARADLGVVELRGNLDTRIDKVARGEADAAVVAAAGLERLDRRAEVETGSLDPAWWVPAPGQGALAVEVATDRADLVELLRPLSDPQAEAEVACERAFASALEGGCSVPLGCLARVDGGNLVVTGYLGAPEGGFALRDRVSGGASDAVGLGVELANALRAAGGDEILLEIDAVDPVQPSPP